MIKPRAKPIVSLFIHCYPPARGGAEFLAEEIVKILSTKYTVHVFTGKGETLDSYKTFSNYINQASNPNIHRLELNQPIQRIYNKLLNKIIFIFGHFSPFYFGPILKYTTKEIDVIRKSKIIFGIAMPTKSFVDAYFFAKKFKKKLVLLPAYHNVSYYNRCYLFQKAFDYAFKILYLTPLEINELQKNYRLDNFKLVQTTFSPFTPANFQPKNVNPYNFSVGFIGQITVRKNLKIFASYLKKYHSYWAKNKTKINIYLAGSKTNSSKEIEETMKPYRKITKIIYNFPENSKRDHYQKIDIFINPSLEESLGISNLEALYNHCYLIIHQNSAFASIDKNIPSFTNIDSLHQQIHKIIKSKKIPKSKILKKFSIDKFQKKLINSVG